MEFSGLMLRQIIRKNLVFTLIAVVIISAFPLFGHLDSQPLRLWDESRLAINSYEMYQSGDLIVTTYHGQPEHWNTKPPLMIWLQCAGMHILGVSEIPVRIPSALAGLMLFLLITWFVYRITGNGFWAFPVVVGLLATRGFNGEHGLRFGEYDTLLAFFLMLQVVFFYLWVLSDFKTRSKYRLVFYLAVVGAVWTKSIAGLLLTPVFLFWAIRKKIWRQNSGRVLVVELLLIVLFSLSYYPIREHQDPGYTSSVIENEITKRYSGDLENHRESMTYYFNEISHQTHGLWWVYLVIVALGLIVSGRNQRQLLVYLTIHPLFYFLVIQLATTKIYWYLLPIYPMFFLASAFSLFILIQKLGTQPRIVVSLKIGLIILLGYIWVDVVYQTAGIKEDVKGDHGFYSVTNFIRDQFQSNEKQDWVFIDTEYSGHNWWYIDRLNDNGHELKYFIDLDSIESGDKLLIRQLHIRDSVFNKYQHNILESNADFALIQLRGLR